MLYRVNSAPEGKWTSSSMREIKKRGAASNPNFKLPDGDATYYASLNYDYVVKQDGASKTINHDVISMTPVILDMKARNAPKGDSTGVYGVDW